LQQQALGHSIFAVASEDDMTVNTSATYAFMARQSNPANKFILYTADTRKGAHKIRPNQELNG